MYCWVILNSMIVDHERPIILLKEGTGRSAAASIRVNDEMEACFVRY